MESKNKKILAVIAIILALITVLGAGTIIAQSTPANRLKRQLRMADKYLSEMNYEQALLAYNEAIKIDPKCEQAYLAIADIYLEQGEEEKAAAILEEGQKYIQTEVLSGKLEEAKSKALTAAAQAGGQGEKPTEPPTQKPTEAPTEAPTEVPTEVPTEAPAQPQAGVGDTGAGDIITFGSYEQDGDTGNGAEPVEWLVLDNQGDRMLVISRYGLDCQQYNTERTDVTWETCTLRGWLNSEFYNTAFNESEKAAVITTTIDNPDNAHRGTIGGNATTDNVFCLSIDEAERYFASGEARAAKATPYAVQRGAYASTSSQWYAGNCVWWLRSPGPSQDDASGVGSTGGVDYGGDRVRSDKVAVRPALWIGINR